MLKMNLLVFTPNFFQNTDTNKHNTAFFRKIYFIQKMYHRTLRYLPAPSSQACGNLQEKWVWSPACHKGLMKLVAGCPSFVGEAASSVTVCETFEMLFPPVCPRRASHLSPKVTPLWMQREQSVSDPSHLLLNDSEGKIVLSLYHSPKNKMHQCSDYETFILKSIRIT